MLSSRGNVASTDDPLAELSFAVDSPDKGKIISVPPLVAIVGRPNVGKSTIFNRLIGSRRSIVSDEPGLTRDRIYGALDWSGVLFKVVDTGGILPGEESEIPRKIFEQAQMAINDASLILFIVDGRVGRTAVDEELASLLRRIEQPVFLLVNKLDSQKHEADVAEFMSFGFRDVFAISAEHGRGFTALLDQVILRLPESVEEEALNEISVAIIGRPNAGKSTLLNHLVGEQRSMVSPIAGTTRDAVDSLIDYEGRRFRFIDTAGIRRKGKTDLKAEKLSVIMARRHLEQSDVAILVIDGFESIAAIDATIGGYAHEAGRSVIIAVNKWDVVEKSATITAEYEKRIREKLKFLEYAPITFISAKTGQRVQKLYRLIDEVNESRRRRIGTGELNQFLKEVSLARGGLPSDVKIRYIVQVRVAPPTFIVFTNSSRKLHFSFERFLMNRIRDRFSFLGTPIIIKQRMRQVRSSK